MDRNKTYHQIVEYEIGVEFKGKSASLIIR
jgi:hypothetical protein